MTQEIIMETTYDGPRELSLLLADYPRLGVTQEIVNGQIRFRYRGQPDACGVWISKDVAINIGEDLLYDYYYYQRRPNLRGDKEDELALLEKIMYRNGLTRGQNYLDVKKDQYENFLDQGQRYYDKFEEWKEDNFEGYQFLGVALGFAIRGFEVAREIAIKYDYGESKVLVAELAHYRALKHYKTEVVPRLSEKELQSHSHSKFRESPAELAGRYFSRFLTSELEEQIVQIVEEQVKAE